MSGEEDMSGESSDESPSSESDTESATEGDESESSASSDVGDQCDSDADDGTCVSCIKDLCCDEVALCLVDPQCVCVLDCMNAGGGPIECATGGTCVIDPFEPPLADIVACNAGCEGEGCQDGRR